MSRQIEQKKLLHENLNGSQHVSQFKDSTCATVPAAAPLPGRSCGVPRAPALGMRSPAQHPGGDSSRSPKCSDSSRPPPGSSLPPGFVPEAFPDAAGRIGIEADANGVVTVANERAKCLPEVPVRREISRPAELLLCDNGVCHAGRAKLRIAWRSRS